MPNRLLLVFLLALLAACGGQPTRSTDSGGTATRGGGYYKDDGPGDNEPAAAALAATPDATPRAEPLHRYANNPYTVLGRDYTPMRSIRPFRQTGLASWYGKKFHGQKTSNGETYDMYAMTAAHPTLPLPSYARVTSESNGKSVIVRVNDRGPFHAERIVDLSYVAAWKLGIIGSGSGRVILELIDPGSELPPAPQPAPEAAPMMASAPSNTSSSPARSPAAEQAARNTGAEQAGRNTGAEQAARNAAAEQAARSAAAESAPARSAAYSPTPASAANKTTSEPAPASHSAAPVAEQAARNAAAQQASPPASTASSPAPAAAQSATAAKPPVPSSSPPGAYIQLGAFNNPDNAEVFRNHMAREFDWLTDRLRSEPGGTVMRVQAGPFRDREEAEFHAEKIRMATGIKPLVLMR